MTGGCRFGSNCKFSHDQRPQGNIPRNGQPSGSRLGSSNQPSDPEREKLQTWRRLRPVPALPGDRQTASYFRMAIDLVEDDVSLAQQVIRDMASERRLLLLKDILELLSQNKTPGTMDVIWNSRISPLFRIILHPSIVDSIVVEQEMATIYRALLGIDATRLRCLFDFVFRIVDHWSEVPLDTDDATRTEVLSLGCGVLAKVIDTSTANIVNVHFTSICEDIQTRLDAFGNQKEDFHTIQASKYLERVRRRLGIGQSLPEASHASASSGAMAEFILSQDLPGSLSQRGRRHDNDHADIADIKLMPTIGEIMYVQGGVFTHYQSVLASPPGLAWLVGSPLLRSSAPESPPP